MKKGLFITLEGMDGSGKSTQARFLSEFLADRGVEHIFTREPGGCSVSEDLRHILLDMQNDNMNYYTEALLYAAARTQLVDEVLLPSLNAGKLVLCDRYIDSSIAYQGYGRGIGAETVRNMNKYAIDHCMPDYTFFFNIGPEQAFRRKSKNKGRDRMEREDAAFYNRIYEGYLQLCKEEPERFILPDISGTKYETKQVMADIMDGLIKKWKES